MGTFVRYKENTQPDRYVSGMKNCYLYSSNMNI